MNNTSVFSTSSCSFWLASAAVSYFSCEASQTECQASFFFLLDSNSCDVCCLPRAGLSPGLTSKSWDATDLWCFYFCLSGLIWILIWWWWWWWWLISDKIYLTSLILLSFTPSLLCWGVIHYSSRKTWPHTVRPSAETWDTHGLMVKPERPDAGKNNAPKQCQQLWAKYSLFLSKQLCRFF